MRKEAWLPVLAATALLGGCGGGGSGGGSGITPPPPPSSGNTSIHELKQSQTFAARTASSDFSVNPISGTAINGTTSSRTLTVSYNASSKSYTVSAAGRSQTFTPADIAAPTDDRADYYRKENGSTGDYLLLFKKAVAGSAATKHVGMGIWERNAPVSDEQIDVGIDAFVYGFDTPAAAAPRTGTASFDTSVYGLTTTPGYEPRVFYGTGQFEVDFGTGIFSTYTPLTEAESFSGEGTYGGGIELTGAGNLSSTDGTFSGLIHYGGANVKLAGSLSGRFYGPSAEELGAAFTASNSDGNTVVGAMTGWRDSSNPRVNFTLANLVKPERFYPRSASLEVWTYDGGETVLSYASEISSSLNLQTSGNLEFHPGDSWLPGGAFTTTSIIPGADPNFTVYEKTFDDRPVRLEMYKPGNENSELQLTYASFGRWSETFSPNPTHVDTTKLFFTYGLTTPNGILAARTGSAHYAGVVYGAGFNPDTREGYDISGASRFDVNFSRQSYSGALTLAGTATSGGKVDFGRYDFTGSVAADSYGSTAHLLQNGQGAGQLTTRFYGPSGEEIAGEFTMIVPDGSRGAGTRIAGVTVAKRQ